MENIKTPLSNRDIEKLKAGNKVLITGSIYTARDTAHRRFIELINQGKELPFDINGQIIYYTGPTPARPGMVIGSAGPTTSSRMDSYTLPLLKKGLKGMIGKGGRSEEVREAIKQYKAVYFLAVGGAGALIARTVKKLDVIAFPELGPEAVMRLEVEDLPAIVAIDCHGGDILNVPQGKS